MLAAELGALLESPDLDFETGITSFSIAEIDLCPRHRFVRSIIALSAVVFVFIMTVLALYLLRKIRRDGES